MRPKPITASKISMKSEAVNHGTCILDERLGNLNVSPLEGTRANAVKSHRSTMTSGTSESTPRVHRFTA